MDHENKSIKAGQGTLRSIVVKLFNSEAKYTKTDQYTNFEINKIFLTWPKLTIKAISYECVDEI